MAQSDLWYTHTLDPRVEDELERAINANDARRVRNILEWATRLSPELKTFYHRTAQELALEKFLRD